jgi:acyl carrier protein
VSPAVLATSDSSTPLLGHGIGLDSIEALTLVVVIENEFDIQVADSDLTTKHFWNIGTLAEYVWQRILEQNTGREGDICLSLRRLQ